jgi:hypothetical protein
MKTKQRITLALLLALTLAAATLPALAAEESLPPLPEWPIIGPLLRLLGVTSEPEEEPVAMATPDPTIKEYRLTSLDDVREVWRELEPGERARLVISEKDLNAFVREKLGAVPGAESLTVDFRTGEVVVTGAVNRAALEEAGVDLPFFLRGRTLRFEVRATPGAGSCRPFILVEEVRVNGRRLPIKGLAQSRLDELLDRAWPSGEGCVEQLIVSPDELSVEGYRGSTTQ